MARNSIWAILCVDPVEERVHNNLLIFWIQKPTFKTFAKAMGVKLPTSEGTSETLTKIWEGGPTEFRGYLYVLKEVRTNVLLDDQDLWGWKEK